mmetsp:Transcript_26856/g.64663  ORF Transcript_26856/g.64663 Transcript_26856/m.64663 type:complete len:216 (-) Transcript_26856:586-1233(-)
MCHAFLQKLLPTRSRSRRAKANSVYLMYVTVLSHAASSSQPVCQRLGCVLQTATFLPRIVCRHSPMDWQLQKIPRDRAHQPPFLDPHKLIARISWTTASNKGRLRDFRSKHRDAETHPGFKLPRCLRSAVHHHLLAIQLRKLCWASPQKGITTVQVKALRNSYSSLEPAICEASQGRVLVLHPRQSTNRKMQNARIIYFDTICNIQMARVSYGGC